jgi:hypothetical protein
VKLNKNRKRVHEVITVKQKNSGFTFLFGTVTAAQDFPSNKSTGFEKLVAFAYVCLAEYEILPTC